MQDTSLAVLHEPVGLFCILLFTGTVSSHPLLLSGSTEFRLHVAGVPQADCKGTDKAIKNNTRSSPIPKSFLILIKFSVNASFDECLDIRGIFVVN